jgi:hypothetical protein
MEVMTLYVNERQQEKGTDISSAEIALALHRRKSNRVSDRELLSRVNSGSAVQTWHLSGVITVILTVLGVIAYALK